MIPSNHKWFRNLAVSQIMADTMEELRLAFPPPSVDLADIRRKYHAALKEEMGEQSDAMPRGGERWTSFKPGVSGNPRGRPEVMATRDRRYPDLRRLVGCAAGFVSVSGCSFRPAIGNSSSP